MKDVDEARLCLGLKNTRDRRRQILLLSQTAYVSKLLKGFRFPQCSSDDVPIQERRDPGKRLEIFGGGPNDNAHSP